MREIIIETQRKMKETRESHSEGQELAMGKLGN